MNPDHIPDLHWNVANTYHTTNIGYIDTQNTVVSTHYIDVETVSYARGDVKIGMEQLLILIHLYLKAIDMIPSVLSFLLPKYKM